MVNCRKIINNLTARFDVIKARRAYDNNLRNKVVSYTCHMSSKCDIPKKELVDDFRKNMNRARKDPQFRKYVLKNY